MKRPMVGQPHKTTAGVEDRNFSQVAGLFPDDFVKLEPPTEYVGAKQIFETLEPPDNKLGETSILRVVSTI